MLSWIYLDTELSIKSENKHIKSTELKILIALSLFLWWFPLFNIGFYILSNLIPSVNERGELISIIEIFVVDSTIKLFFKSL